MLASIFSLNVLQTALELGCIYALVALALFLSYSILNIADLSTDGCFTLGCAVACQVALTGHPILALVAAMAAGVCSGFVTAFLQTRLGVESIMAADAFQTFLEGIPNLTKTERRIFDGYVAGLRSREIVEQLDIKDSTLRFHNKNIYEKLGVSSLKQLQQFAAILNSGGNSAPDSAPDESGPKKAR